MKKLGYIIIAIILVLHAATGCQQGEPLSNTESSFADPDPSTQSATQKTFDEEFAEMLEAAKCVRVYFVCEEGEQSITYTVAGKQYTVTSLKLIQESTEETELLHIQQLFGGWIPSENERESEDCLAEVYIWFDNGLLISYVRNSDYARIGQTSYTLPSAFCEFIDQLIS